MQITDMKEPEKKEPTVIEALEQFVIRVSRGGRTEAETKILPDIVNIIEKYDGLELQKLIAYMIAKHEKERGEYRITKASIIFAYAVAVISVGIAVLPLIF